MDALTNTLRKATDAIITVRVIKSFEFRTTKNLLLPHANLETMTVGELKAFVRQGELRHASWTALSRQKSKRRRDSSRTGLLSWVSTAPCSERC